jgi:hypothetical protein
MTNNDKIENFCYYFHDRIKEIEALNNPLFQKILIIILMDTFSRVWTKGLENKNKLRFLKLIRECINWEHSDRISVPMVIYRLEKLSLKINDKLKLKLDDLFKYFKSGRILRVDIDPYYFEIKHLAESREEIELLKKSRHAELLYTYRNNLIHEFRKPGRGMEFSDDNESPYYHGMTDLDHGGNTWELVYPTNFLINLSKVGLNTIKAFLASNKLDPYSLFQFGSPW